MPLPRPRLRALLLALPVLLLPAAPPAGAAQALLVKSLPGTSWTAATVTTDGAEVSSTITATDVARPFQAGVRVYDGERRVVYAATVNALGSVEGAVVDVQAAGVEVSHDAREGDGTRLGLVDVAVVLNEGGSGELVGSFTVVLWTASKQAGPHFWRVEGQPGASAGASATGRETWLFDSSDFRGTASAVGGTGGVAARAQYGTRKAVRVKRTMLGSFSPVVTSVDAMAVRQPDGVLRQCLPSCEFTAVTGAGRAGPGEYLFQLTGAGAGGALQNTGDVLLGGADVALPAT